MHNLKSMVTELFEQDQLMNGLVKEIKTKTAQYNHLLLNNTEKLYSDQELIAINTHFHELQELKKKQAAISENSQQIREQLKSFILPLNGGRWIHATEDLMHPNWEFWLEEDELKYAKMNGRNY